MKLLDKKQVNTQATTERKNQIDEGIILAQKIDKLRQTLGELESQHSTFLGGIQRELKEASDESLRKIAQLEVDIKDLEEKKALLQIPLDSEWDKVNKKATELQNQEDLIKKSLVVIEERHKKSDEKYDNAKLVVQRINLRERELNKVYETQEKILHNIELRNQHGIEEKERLDAYIEIKKQELLSREANVAVKEREVGMARAQVEKDSRELINRTALIQDREETLDREILRKNGNISSTNSSSK